MTSAALHVARTGLDAQNARMRVIANNLANVSTTGFKRERAQFETLAYQHVTAAGATSSGDARYAIGQSLGTGVRIAGTQRQDGQGTLSTTGNALDIAIEGSGLFAVRMGDGRTGYTRAGNFTLSADGAVVTGDGLTLEPPLSVPEGATAITIGVDGRVSATLPGDGAATEIGQIQTARFANAAALESVGGNVLVETVASGPAQVGTPGSDGRGGLRQGMLEGSNVNVVEELVDMIETQRAYEVASKMIQTGDEMLQYVTQQIG